METEFAPAERQPFAIVEQQFNDVLSVSYVKDLLQALPYIAAVLNEQRQIVYANDTVVKMFGFDCVEQYLGKRPGELLSCIHSTKKPGGCGTSENCSVCGAVNAILKSRANNEKTSDECRISSIIDGKPISFDLRVTASPIQIAQQPYTLLSINDISSEKRRRMLERIFFHDILNISGGIEGVVNLLKMTKDSNEIRQMIDIASEATHQLNEEIITQRELLAAENNELEIDTVSISSSSIIDLAINSIKGHDAAIDKTIKASAHDEKFTIRTDKVLLVRVLVNMLKNALEASSKQSEVGIGYRKENSECIFWVHNQGAIPHKVQLQIFQRSYSTKGVGRGIGTYSMKVLTENYLKGKVWFATNPQDGTTFYVSLPM